MTESDPTVLLVAWSGPTSALAARLGCAPSAVLAALRALGRDTSKAGISLPIALANPAPIWAATRRRCLIRRNVKPEKQKNKIEA